MESQDKATLGSESV